MIKAAIVDDEQSCIDRLTRLLGEYPDDIGILVTARSAPEAVSAIKQHQPDLLLLDVQLGNATGFDVLEGIRDVECEVIFTTAFEQYAVQAFRFSAIDYLLKPVDPDDLAVALARVKEKLSKSEMSKKLDVLFHNLKTLEGTSKKITVPTMAGFEVLQVSDIIRCESEVNYTHIFVKGHKKITVARTLKDFEEMLTEFNFCRVHNSHLINLAHILKYNKGTGGYVTMSDDSEVEVSQRKKDEFLKRMATI